MTLFLSYLKSVRIVISTIINLQIMQIKSLSSAIKRYICALVTKSYKLSFIVEINVERTKNIHQINEKR